MKRLLIYSLLIAAQTPCLAAESTADFLKIGVGARAAGMGNAYTAVTDDVTAVYWNPAGLTGVANNEAGAMHSRLYDEANYDFAALALRNGNAVWAVSANYLSYSDLEGRDANRNRTGTFGASDLALNLSYANALAENLSAGFSVKYIRSTIEDASASGGAVDVGVKYKAGGRLTLGAAASNIGPKVKFISDSEPLPLTFALGAAYRATEKLLFAADYKTRPNDRDNEFALGLEYKMMSPLALRFGYNTKTASPYKSSKNSGIGVLDNLMGFAAGVGVSLGQLSVDYGFTPSGELGNTQKLSLSVKF